MNVLFAEGYYSIEGHKVTTKKRVLDDESKEDSTGHVVYQWRVSPNEQRMEEVATLTGRLVLPGFGGGATSSAAKAALS